MLTVPWHLIPPLVFRGQCEPYCLLWIITLSELGTDFDCKFSRLPDLCVLILTADCSLYLGIHHLSSKMRTIFPSVFKKTQLINELRRLYDNFLVVPADKANKYCKICLLNELGFTSTVGNPTYTRTNFTKDEILQNHLFVLNIFYILKNQDQFKLH
jgi:hypothetical protein